MIYLLGEKVPYFRYFRTCGSFNFAKIANLQKRLGRKSKIRKTQIAESPEILKNY
jgi:hypothetical protein